MKGKDKKRKLKDLQNRAFEQKSHIERIYIAGRMCGFDSGLYEHVGI
jgi:hypothetical protein